VFVCLVKQHPTRKQYELLSKFEEAPLAVLGSMKTDIAGSMKPYPTPNPQALLLIRFCVNKNVLNNEKNHNWPSLFSFLFPRLIRFNLPNPYDLKVRIWKVADIKFLSNFSSRRYPGEKSIFYCQIIDILLKFESPKMF
jgi:hypothetical protein